MTKELKYKGDLTARRVGERYPETHTHHTAHLRVWLPCNNSSVQLLNT